MSPVPLAAGCGVPPDGLACWAPLGGFACWLELPLRGVLRVAVIWTILSGELGGVVMFDEGIP